MTKKCKMIMTICLIIMMSLTCMRIDNTSDFFDLSAASLGYTNSVVLTQTDTLDVNRRYSRIEQQDYLYAQGATRVSTSLSRRSQNHIRSFERNEVIVAVLGILSKVVLFSFFMILFATSGTRLSMPFQCLLYYIHNMDGKKKIA